MAHLANSPLWLPYTQMATAKMPLKIASTQGEHLYCEDGRVLVDGLASWWTACHGYNHPKIIAAMQAQLERMPHIMLGGLSHEPAEVLASGLVAITPADLNHVFFSDSGSVAVEVALKIAVQYWRNRGDLKKTRFVHFHGAYHGDTLGAMAVSDSELGFHRAFAHYTPEHCLIHFPTSEAELEQFDRFLSIYGSRLAGAIMEPLVQGAAGMRMFPAKMLKAVCECLKKHRILCIIDEVFTGFGRTGTLFACEQANVVPDIMVLSKALTAGTIGMGATLVTTPVFERFQSPSIRSALMHGPTFMGNPLACAAALASIQLFKTQPILQQVKAIEVFAQRELNHLADYHTIRAVRILGAIIAVEFLQLDMAIVETITAEEGVWLRPIGNVLYTTPAFNISEEGLCKILCTMKRIAQAHK